MGKGPVEFMSEVTCHEHQVRSLLLQIRSCCHNQEHRNTCQQSNVCLQITNQSKTEKDKQNKTKTKQILSERIEEYNKTQNQASESFSPHHMNVDVLQNSHN